jgi:hypothetical protein
MLFEAELRRLIPSLEHVLADSTHVMRRYLEVIPNGHCGRGGFMCFRVDCNCSFMHANFACLILQFFLRVA